MSRLLRGVLAAALVYGLALGLGTALFLAIIRAGLFAGIPILFYRGIAALALTFGLLVAGLAGLARVPRLGLTPRETVGASVTAVALLLAAFTLGPVTVDRSISVFVLSRFAAAPGPLDEPALRDAFVRTYVGDWAQIQRRLDEQVASGNLVRREGGYRLTPQGERFMRTARDTARLFDTDRRFVGLPEAP
ncbi:hypothetical protein [Methylobacterium sp. ID0610]|uniref:hypothetical protein n=1 Tax=Methylobacterium carpenticola TaxID=3344827 RepID=UPI0036C36ADD